jgi:hypothetical protein
VQLPGPTIGGVQSFGDPLFDVAGSVSNVLTDSEPGWASAFVAPGVERGHGNAQVVGELLGCEQAVECLHHPIVSERPVIRVLSGCQPGVHLASAAFVAERGFGVVPESIDTPMTGLLTL